MARPAVVIGALVVLAAIALYKKDELIMLAKSMSDSGLKFLAGIEGFSAHPYPDAQGQSVGFGHFILPEDSFIFPMDKKTAYDLLYADTAIATTAINSNVKVPLTPNQFDALVSLVYNIGVGAFKSSTLLKKLNAGDYAGAAAQFAVWNKSQKVVLPALVARRAKEKELFQTA